MDALSTSSFQSPVSIISLLVTLVAALRLMRPCGVVNTVSKTLFPWLLSLRRVTSFAPRSTIWNLRRTYKVDWELARYPLAQALPWPTLAARALQDPVATIDC